MKYVVFLRGINVGGNSTVSMSELKKSLETAGFMNIQTILNSGNIILESSEADRVTLKAILERLLEKTFGFPIRVLLREEKELLALLKKEPFKSVQVTPTLRLNVTFLTENSEKEVDPQGSFQVIAKYPDAVCTVIDTESGKGSPDMMAVLEKTYGKTITTRTWNTLQRIGKFL